jgi:hypothetical protein
MNNSVSHGYPMGEHLLFTILKNLQVKLFQNSLKHQSFVPLPESVSHSILQSFFNIQYCIFDLFDSLSFLYISVFPKKKSIITDDRSSILF